VNGAHALIQTLVGADVNVCFANPGTSEMHFVGALDDVPSMRVVLGLFEGVVTGAADGYARTTGRPAATLLHLGPGLANGMANLHNARRARVPMVNIVGDHATYHKKYDSPLNSDIETVARTFSTWVGTPRTPREIGQTAAEAVGASYGPPGGIATLILPADVSWGENAEPAQRGPVPVPRPAEQDAIAAVAKLLTSGERCLLLIGGSATTADALRAAHRIATGTGAEVLLETSTARLERGGDIPELERLKYRSGGAIAQLTGVQHLILVDAKEPVAFFAYPDKASYLVPDGCQVHWLAAEGEDATAALAELAQRTAPGTPPDVPAAPRPGYPAGELTAASAAAAVAALLPEDVIVINEAITSGAYAESATAGGPRHLWLSGTGGAIGLGLPMAVGAAVAAPDRKVIALQADGSAMYTIQALWTMARENLDVTTVIYNNRHYGILKSELRRVGASGGPKAADVLEIGRPDLDFVAIARGMGVEAERADTAEKFTAALGRALSAAGPRLVEAVLP
jgi:acetolactate synthase I/II/III large subunit